MKEKKILVVDDSAVNLKLAGKIIKSQEGWKPILVPSGQRALKYLEENQANLILLDVMMPEMDGFQLLQILQGDERLAKIPVVMLTGDEDAETKEQGRQAGIKAMLHKPFDISHLLDTITKYID